MIEKIKKLLEDGSEEALREAAELLWAADSGLAEPFEPPEAPMGELDIDWAALREKALESQADAPTGAVELGAEARTTTYPRRVTNGHLKHLFLGYDARGKGIRLQADERKTHMHVIGSSGSGKSKFLEWMIRGQLRNTEGFCLIDPHGPLYHDVLKYCAHHVLKREIIPLDLTNSHPVVGFNPFQRIAGGDVSVQVDRRITATLHAWGMANTDQTPTLGRTLRLVYTAMIEANLTLPEARHLIDFDQGRLRGQLIERIESPLVRQEWQAIQQYDLKDWQAEFLSAKNRLFRLLTNKTLGRFMGLPENSLDLEEIMDQGKILLVNLGASDSWSADNARVFGSLLLNEFFEAARRRKNGNFKGNPKPYFLYLDEFQRFVSLDIADMLDEVRKFGLFLVLAHQRFKQLDENVLEAALTNCRIKAVFGGLTAEAAKVMAEELFIGKLDPKKVKAAIYQTKFWPKYRRDKVYSRSTSQGSTVGTAESSATARMSGMTSGEVFGPSEWFGASQEGTSRVTSSGTTDISGRSTGESSSFSESESEADIPIFFPVPFSELSSLQYYSIAEQLTELTAALKEQYPRHCFIKIREQDTQPMLVPFVPEYYTRKENFKWYEEKLLCESGALPPAEVDSLIDAREQFLLEEARQAKPLVLPQASRRRPAKPQRIKKTKPESRNLFDELLSEDEDPGKG